MSRLKIGVTAMAFAVGLVGFGFGAQPAAAAETESEGVMRFATRQLNKPYRLGANGMRRFDCSGLVYRTFKENGIAHKIGGNRRANGYYKYFKNRGQLTKNPRKGDLVVWAKRGKRVSHIGIFQGYNKRGKPMAVSALVNPYGVTKHKVRSINIPFKAYLDVKL